MGASTFITQTSGSNLQEAFAAACQDASFEHGHGGYSGTVAEKHSVVALDKTPRWSDEGLAYAEALLEARDERISDKWGPAGAIPVCSVVRTARVTVSSSRSTSSAALEQMARDKVRIERGEELVSLRSTSSAYDSHTVTVNYEASIRRAGLGTSSTRTIKVVVDGSSSSMDFRRKVKEAVDAKMTSVAGQMAGWRIVTASSKTKSEVTVGKGRQTSYVLKESVSGWNRATDAPKYFSSLTEAKAALKQAMADSGAAGREASFEIVAETRSAEGAPLVSATSRCVSTTVEVEVTVIKGRTRPTTIDGWVLVGWASC